MKTHNISLHSLIHVCEEPRECWNRHEDDVFRVSQDETESFQARADSVHEAEIGLDTMVFHFANLLVRNEAVVVRSSGVPLSP